MIAVPKYVGWPLVALSGFGALYWAANRSIYYPFRYPEGSWELREQIGAEDAWVTTSDGVRLHGWWKAPEGARLATLFLHGNAGNVTHRARHIVPVTSAGSAILVLDYRGYGRSEGRPTESGLYHDADAGWQALLARGHRPDQIIIHGESLGSAVAVDLASRVKCAGVILEAPFSSAKDVARSVLPLVGPLLIWGYDSVSKIGRLKAPLLVVHGDRDDIIPFALGRRLFDAAPEPKQFWRVEGGGHNDLVETAGAAYPGRLADFYRRLTIVR